MVTYSMPVISDSFFAPLSFLERFFTQKVRSYFSYLFPPCFINVQKRVIFPAMDKLQLFENERCNTGSWRKSWMSWHGTAVYFKSKKPIPVILCE